MSMQRVCDCPDPIHEESELIGGGGFWEIAGKDICPPCARGKNGCHYWQPRVLLPIGPVDELLRAAYAETIKEMLR